VIKQFPEPEATVKVNRIIYLTINRLIPPSIAMPNLIGMSLRNALIELRSLGLKLGDTSFVPDIAKNAVKDQLIDGVPIKPGDLVRMGAIIDLQIGAGVVGNELPVPDLFGLNYQEALLVIEVNGLSPGVIILDENLADTSAGFVYWQNPMPVNEQFQQNRIRSGQLIDMKLSASKPEKVSDTLNIPNN
jgi:beta-lactam-binding protein with PASTA domain